MKALTQAYMSLVQELPADIWASLIEHLSLQDLMRARLVSKHFVRLDTLPGLTVHVHSSSPTACSSFAVFVQRHCTGPASLRLAVDVLSGGGIPGIMIAARCSNLLVLDCATVTMTLAEGRKCLGLLPPTLTGLTLQAPLSLLGAAGWQRVSNLTHLMLASCETPHPCVALALGLQYLPKLESLTVTDRVSGMAATPQLDLLEADSFQHAGLTYLAFGRDILNDAPINLASQLPALLTLAITNYRQIPPWLYGQAFATLELWDSRQLETSKLSNLLCSRLSVLCCGIDSAWRVMDFLQMSRLTELASVCRDVPGEPILMHGSRENHQKLLHRTHMQLEYPIQLCVPQSNCDILNTLSKNGGVGGLGRRINIRRSSEQLISWEDL